MRFQLLNCTISCLDCVVGWIACLLGSPSTEHDHQHLDTCAYSALRTQPSLDCTIFVLLCVIFNFFTEWILHQRSLAITAGWLQFCNLRLLHLHQTADIIPQASSAEWPQLYFLSVSPINFADDCNILAFSAGWLQDISILTSTTGWNLTVLSLFGYPQLFFIDHSHLLNFGVLLLPVNKLHSVIHWCLCVALLRAVQIPHLGAPSWLDWTFFTETHNNLCTLAYSEGWPLVWQQRFFQTLQVLAYSAGWLLRWTQPFFQPSQFLAYSAGWLLVWIQHFLQISQTLAYSAGWLLRWTRPHFQPSQILAYSAGWLLVRLQSFLQIFQTLAYSAGWLLRWTKQIFQPLQLLVYFAGWLLRWSRYFLINFLSWTLCNVLICVGLLSSLTLANSAGWLLNIQRFYINFLLAYSAGWLLNAIIQLAQTFLQLFHLKTPFGTWQRGPSPLRLQSIDQAASGTLPGPKSGRSRILKVAYVLIMTAAFQSTLSTTCWSGGEGCDLSTKVTGALPTWEDALLRQSGAKHSGTQPQISFGSWPYLDVVKKRSLHRAHKRALRDGSCWYKGQCLTVADFPRQWTEKLIATQQPCASPPSTSPSLSDMTACNRRQQNRRYLRYVNWNGSGMSSHRLDELKLWCESQCTDLLILTETRWKYCNEWCDRSWIHLHSGCADQPGAGILILISRKLCDPEAVRWTEVVSGRLVHVQIRLPQRCFDVVAAYQHTFAHTKTRQAERMAWWSHLDRYLGTLPKRHVLLLTGDFNCRLPAARGHVGHSSFTKGAKACLGFAHPDEGHFLTLVKSHFLVALNSWNSKLGPTFQGPNSCSRIDFAFTRVPTADGCSRAIRYLHAAPFLSCDHVGHFPMIGQLRKFWIPPQADTRSAGISLQQRKCGAPGPGMQ